MNKFGAKRVHNYRNRGFSLIEIVVVLMITSLIASIAIPRYLNTKQQEHLTVAKSDGDNLFREIGDAVSNVQSFGTTNGSIVFNNSTNIMTVTFGSGGDTLAPFLENVSNGTTVTGVTYANTLNWCINVANQGSSAIFTQDGFQTGLIACP